MIKELVFLASIINVIAFAMYGIDKEQARKGRWRISESALLGVALLGGSIGALAGMYVFRHKTRKAKFYIGVPIIIVLQAFILVALMFDFEKSLI